MEEAKGSTANTELCPYCKAPEYTWDSEQSCWHCTKCDATIRPINTREYIAGPGTQKYRFVKKQEQERIANATERNLAFAFSELDRISSANNLPAILRESAVSVYRKAIEHNLTRGRSIEAIAAASVYASCRICGIPRTLEEISETTSLNKRELWRTYRYISRQLKLNLSPAKPQDYVPRFCKSLSLNEKTQQTAIDLLNKAEGNAAMSGLGPSGVAAAAVYISAIECGDHKSQNEVAEKTGITKVTLRSRYKKLAQLLGLTVEFD